VSCVIFSFRWTGVGQGRIHPVLRLLGIAETGYTVVKLGGKILRSRFARPVITLLSVLVWGLGGVVIASLLWPQDLVGRSVFICACVAMAYFDKRAFRAT
jgi:hypothetical protein